MHTDKDIELCWFHIVNKIRQKINYSGYTLSVNPGCENNKPLIVEKKDKGRNKEKLIVSFRKLP